MLRAGEQRMIPAGFSPRAAVDGNVGEGFGKNFPAEFGNRRLVENVRQPITQAAAPQSIGPTPGDITGSQPTPAVDAGRGGWMGGPGKGKVVNPFYKPGGPLVKQKRGQMAEQQPIQQVRVNVEEPSFSSAPQQPQRQSKSDSGFRGQFSREMMNRQLGNRSRRESMRNIIGGLAAAGGTGAGLAALIGGEREQREEEAMV